MPSGVGAALDRITKEACLFSGARNNMKVIFCIHTPAHVHLFRNVVTSLLGRGHEIKILARDYGSTLTLLDHYNLKYQVYIRHSNGHKYMKGFQLFDYVFREYKLSRTFKPDLIVGIGPDEPLLATLLLKPCVLFNDSERMPVQHLVNRMFADVIITPWCFDGTLGKKQLRIQGCKELAYLHPNSFEPDPSILDELKLSPGEKYVILRFNAFDAFHDIGKHGFPVKTQIELVEEMRKYARVFISPEGALPPSLEKYVLPIAKDRIHHALNYAHLLVTDTQTMATEAAVLGTPVVRCNNWVGPNDMGIFKALEQQYGLIYSFVESEQAVSKAIELMGQPNLKEEWAIKRQRLLSDKIDVAQFLADFIDEYPKSLARYQRKKELT